MSSHFRELANQEQVNKCIRTVTADAVGAGMEIINRPVRWTRSGECGKSSWSRSAQEALTGQRIQWSSTGENDRHKEKGKTPMPPGFQLLRRSLWLPSQVSGIPEFPQRIMVDLPRFLHAWKMV
ncbi:uncharacterized protein [Manis javanica]|uniref:uncharacterized protein isoform X1 n=1 Tax=Manis javanica TaxID=9974 RepID=UPI003C6D2A40